MSKSQKYFVYILRCADRSLYVGYTTNLKKRLFWHYKGFASQFTAQRRPVTLVYSEVHEDEHAALACELQLKSWSRQKKGALIEGDQKRLKNLSKSREQA